MANREQRGNKEKRKPKADKAKPAGGAASPFSSAVADSKAGKKAR